MPESISISSELEPTDTNLKICFVSILHIPENTDPKIIQLQMAPVPKK